MATQEWKDTHQEEMRKYRRDYYHRNKQDHFDRNKKSWDKIRKFILGLKITLKCTKCPESDPRCLDFHHEDPKQKSVSIARIHRMGWSLEKVQKEIDKCIVLCSNCHRKEHLSL